MGVDALGEAFEVVQITVAEPGDLGLGRVLCGPVAVDYELEGGGFLSEVDDLRLDVEVVGEDVGDLAPEGGGAVPVAGGLLGAEEEGLRFLVEFDFPDGVAGAAVLGLDEGFVREEEAFAEVGEADRGAAPVGGFAVEDGGFAVCEEDRGVLFGPAEELATEGGEFEVSAVRVDGVDGDPGRVGGNFDFHLLCFDVSRPHFDSWPSLVNHITE